MRQRSKWLTLNFTAHHWQGRVQQFWLVQALSQEKFFLTTKLKGMVFSCGAGVLACEIRQECSPGENRVSQVSAFHGERCFYWMNSGAGLGTKINNPQKMF